MVLDKLINYVAPFDDFFDWQVISRRNEEVGTFIFTRQSSFSTVLGHIWHQRVRRALAIYSYIFLDSFKT